ncbi:MAG: hypothetical protein PWQ55_1343 [Chloroflexota bacterium]|nr:hypothetical protein [Chloroflexota bacterium]
MKSVVVYYSKSGNTRQIAEAIAQTAGCEALPLNVMHKGRASRQQAVLESSYASKALQQARSAELVLLGTPTEFRKPHPVMMDFIRRVRPRQAAVFCTYYGMLGGTLLDLRAVLRQQGAILLGSTAFRLGTEDYRLRQNIQEYAEAITPANLAAARNFARDCTTAPQPLPMRMRGVCWKDCTQCEAFQAGRCPGAGANCWSGRECEIFKCCIFKKSLPDCAKCRFFEDCEIRTICNAGGLS